MGIHFPSAGGVNLDHAVSNSFKDGLKNKSNEDLINMLSKDNLSAGQREAVSKELESRLKANQAEGAGGGGGDDEDDVRKLLKKLQDGTISPEEMKKLAGMLGVNVDALEKVKGKGQEEPETDIQGG